MRNLVLLLVCAVGGVLLSGCAAIAIIDTTVGVATTVVGTTVDVAASAVGAVTGSSDDEDEDKGAKKLDCKDKDKDKDACKKAKHEEE